MELLAGYNCDISYHTGKENVVDDAMTCMEQMVSYNMNYIATVMIQGIFEQLRAAQSEGLKENHVKKR